MAARSGAYPFTLFCAGMIVQFFVVLSIYPETKGITLEYMQKPLEQSRGPCIIERDFARRICG